MTPHNYAWILIPRYFPLILPTYVRAAILNFMLQVSTIVSKWRHEDEIQINCLVVKFFWVLTKSWSSMTSVNFVWLEKDSTKLVFNYICIRLICHRLKETHITLNYLSSHLLLTIKGCMSFLQTMTNFDSSKNKTKAKSFNLKHIQIYQNKLYTFKIK
jgi:hypothetical protein